MLKPNSSIQENEMSHKLSVWMILFAVCFRAPLVALAVANEEDCVSNYNEFQDTTLNKPGTDNQFKLHSAFYPPNGRQPYSVEVTYQTTLSNGTVVDIITDGAGYRNKVWVWLSSPIFLQGRPEFLNLLTVMTLNNFEKWVPPRVKITVPKPCQNRTFDFLKTMTASLADCAAGNFKVRVQRGNVVVINVNAGLFHFTPSKEKSPPLDNYKIYILFAFGFLFLLVLLWAVFFAVIKSRVREFVVQMNHYSYQYYGLAWGGCVVALGLLIVVWYENIVVLFQVRPSVPIQYAVYIPYMCYGILCFASGIPIAVYFAYKTTPPPVPYMFLLPAALLCCCKRRYAQLMVFGLGLFICMMAIQYCLNIAIFMLFVMFAEPVVMITNIFILILLVFCLTNIFALLFTISAYIFTARGSRRMQKSSTVLKAALLVPLFGAITSFCLVLATCAKMINDNPSNALSIIGSAILPIVLGTLIFVLKRVVSKVVEVPRESLNGDVATSGTPLRRNDTSYNSINSEP